MNRIDLEVSLLSDKPIMVGDIPIYSVPLSTMAQFGFTEYNKWLSLLCIEREQIRKPDGTSVDDISPFVYIVGNCLFAKKAMMEEQNPSWGDVFNLEKIMWLIGVITRSSISYSSDEAYFAGEGFKITVENFDEFQLIVRARHGLLDTEEDIDVEQPANEAARRVLARRREEREKRKKARLAKSNNEDGEDALNIADLISIFASKTHMSTMEVMQYDTYQFYNQFRRLEINSAFDLNIEALMHGASSSSVNLTSWKTKIKASEE